MTRPKLPRELIPTGHSVALIGMTLGPGSIAHRASSKTVPDLSRPRHSKKGPQPTKQVPIAKCAEGQGDDADDAYLVSAHWADHKGAVACTETACFPTA
ncbi:hypothetical protein OWR29_25435 [Actinoplanes sp. Pm04-4]|uniref:Uncharacterized protein n=1 Tax=Paractinoplanes pyxinae TaxID=2997416 RepID=A0ABT4B681_9ACTN|nr:hypothetical protein [Actinoplanes pyxinae]MCY1141355.1 hypothetical protein [Actinoplanes pyxinae]